MDQHEDIESEEKSAKAHSAKTSSDYKEIKMTSTKSIKEMLENNDSEIDFIEKSSSVINSPIKVVNMSDTSSDGNISDIGEKSINLDNTDLQVSDVESPTVSLLKENQLSEKQTDLIYSTKSSMMPRKIKTILKNQASHLNDVNLQRKDNLKCRSMLEEEIQNLSELKPTMSSYTFLSLRDKPPQLKRPKERPYSNYEQTNLIVKDDPENLEQCHMINCPCRRYSDISACALRSKNAHNSTMMASNKRLRQMPLNNHKNSLEIQRNSGLSVIKELQIQAYLNSSFAATQKRMIPNYENFNYLDISPNANNSQIKHSKTMNTINHPCSCSAVRSKSLGGIRYLNEPDHDRQIAQLQYPTNYFKYSQKHGNYDLKYMRTSSKYVNESSDNSESELNYKYSKPSRNHRHQHRHHHHHNHNSKHNRHYRMHRSREIEEDKKKRSSSYSYKQHREWPGESDFQQKGYPYLNLSEKNLNKEKLYYYSQEPDVLTMCNYENPNSYQRGSDLINGTASSKNNGGIKISNTSENYIFNNAMFSNDFKCNNNNAKLMPKVNYLNNERLRNPVTSQTSQQQQPNIQTRNEQEAIYQVKNKRLEQVKKPGNTFNKNKTKKLSYNPIIYSTKYNDMLTENASFIDSPIHVLMSHHKNRRLIKQQKFEDEKMEKLAGLSSKSDPKIRFEDEVTVKQPCVLNVEPIAENRITNEIAYSVKEDTGLVSENTESQKRRKFLALLLTSLITISSIYLFEIQSCLFSTSIRHLIIYQGSLCLTCFAYIYLMSTNFYWRRIFKLKETSSNTRIENYYFFNVFRCNQSRIINRSDENLENDELKDLMDITTPGLPSEFIHIKKTIFTLNHFVKSNFYLISLSLFTVNFWMLSSYINWYLVEVNIIVAQQLKISEWIENICAVLGGVATSVFFKTIIFDLFEINFDLNDLNIGDFSLDAFRKNSAQNKVLIYQDDSSQPIFDDDSDKLKRELLECDDLYRREKHLKLVIDFIDKQQKAITGHYQKIIFKFLIIIQSHWFLTLGFLAYIFKMLNSKTIQNSLNFICYHTEMQGRTSKFCLDTLISESSLNWQNEIIFRSGLNPINNAKLNKLPTLMAQNQTTQSVNLKPKLEQTSDIYLVLITIALINFVISLMVILFLIKSNKKLNSKSADDRNCRELLFEKKDSDEYLRVDANIINHTNKKMKFFKLWMLHSSMPLMFFHGISKTILINELMKIYAVCLIGTENLLKLVFIYGCSSFVSIMILALLIVICNLKRSIMFLLIIVQQTTLIVLLFYWDPSRTNDTKTYYIGYVYFVCFAICNNLWLTHNLKTLLVKSNELNKSPSVILFYGYSIFCLGTLAGYAATSYFCTTLKLYLTVFLLLLFSGIYIASETVFCLKKKTFVES